MEIVVDSRAGEAVEALDRRGDFIGRQSHLGCQLFECVGLNDDALVARRTARIVRKVAVEESVCSPRASAILRHRRSALGPSADRRRPKELVLTAWEALILSTLAMGLPNRDIALRLCIALHTVKNDVHSVLTKRGVSTRAEAAALSRIIR
jgi:DNA-binding NarL/FixJ family response regulator